MQDKYAESMTSKYRSGIAGYHVHCWVQAKGVLQKNKAASMVLKVGRLLDIFLGGRELGLIVIKVMCMIMTAMQSRKISTM